MYWRKKVKVVPLEHVGGTALCRCSDISPLTCEHTQPLALSCVDHFYTLCASNLDIFFQISKCCKIGVVQNISGVATSLHWLLDTLNHWFSPVSINFIPKYSLWESRASLVVILVYMPIGNCQKNMRKVTKLKTTQKKIKKVPWK